MLHGIFLDERVYSITIKGIGRNEPERFHVEEKRLRLALVEVLFMSNSCGIDLVQAIAPEKAAHRKRRMAGYLSSFEIRITQ